MSQSTVSNVWTRDIVDVGRTLFIIKAGLLPEQYNLVFCNGIYFYQRLFEEVSSHNIKVYQVT